MCSDMVDVTHNDGGVGGKVVARWWQGGGKVVARQGGSKVGIW